MFTATTALTLLLLSPAVARSFCPTTATKSSSNFWIHVHHPHFSSASTSTLTRQRRRTGNNNIIILTRGGAIMSSSNDDTTAKMQAAMQEQWKMWPYFEESIKWHADWLRFDGATGNVKEHFRGIRDFQAHGDHTIQQNTYMYGDERGTVSQGPLCGPWKMSREDCSTENGMLHTSRPTMRTLLGPDRTAVWMMEKLEPGKVTGMELFLGDGEHLRLSVGILYSDQGKLMHIGVIREDARGYETGSWNGPDESFAIVESVDALPFLQSPTGARNVVSSFQVSVPGPVQTTTELSEKEEIDSFCSSLLFVNPQQSASEQTIFQLPDNIYLVCPQQLLSGNGGDGSLRVAVAWKKDDESLASTIEASYSNNVMEKMVYAKFKSQE